MVYLLLNQVFDVSHSTLYKGKDSIQKGNFFSKFNQWKSFYDTNSVSSSNENASKLIKKTFKI